jgi:spermidine/putrescine transport system permease protein
MTEAISMAVPTSRGARWLRLRNGLSERPILVYAFLFVWSVIVFLPLLVLFAYSFFETKNFFTVYTPTLNTWVSFFESGRFSVALRTLRIALTVTVIDLAIAFPFALWLAKGSASKGTRAIAIALLTIPFFLDLSSRIIVWRSILGDNGLINTVLLNIGSIAQPLGWLLYSEWSVHFGMVVTYFPLMVLPIYMAISVIDDTLLQASADLGASPFQTLTRIVLPLALPGILTGLILTLGSALAAWLEPSMLGGGFVNLLSNSVESAYTALNYPVVAALSSFVVILLCLLMAVLALAVRRFADMRTSFSALRS